MNGILLPKLLKFEAEGREFAKISRSLEQFIQTVKRQNNFGNKKKNKTHTYINDEFNELHLQN